MRQARRPDPRHGIRHHAAHFEQAVRADLQARRWLRVHAMLFGTLCFVATWGLSTLLMHAGVASLALRWALALVAGYGVFLLLLNAWCRWLLSRERADGDLPDVADLADLPLPRGGGEPVLRAGGGGDFGGGGAEAGFDVPVAEAGEAIVRGAGRAADGLGELGDLDEGALVVVPLAVVAAIAMLIAASISLAVFGLFGVEVLLGVAVEIAFAAAGGALAFRARREGWLAHAFGRTWKPALALLLVVLALGVVIGHWLPQARSLPHAVQLLRG